MFQKNYSDREKRVILLMIPNCEIRKRSETLATRAKSEGREAMWQSYVLRTMAMALSCCKKLSTLLRGITSKNNGDFYCLNCLHSFRITQT